DAVLQRYNSRTFAQQRAELRTGSGGVVGLHAEENHVARADLGRGVGRERRHLEVAAHTSDPPTVGAQGGQGSTAGDEVDVVPGEGKPAAVVAAHSAGSEYRDPHVDSGRAGGRPSHFVDRAIVVRVEATPAIRLSRTISCSSSAMVATRTLSRNDSAPARK